MGDNITIVNDDNFEQEVLKAELPVIVDFWAEWCGPCRMLAPILDEISAEYAGKVKVCKCNVDDNRVSAEKYEIRSIPALKVFNKGDVVREEVGVKPKEAIVALFKDLI